MDYHLAFDLPLKRNPYKGLYIALEGIDGSGKTTQVNLLRSYFEKKGKTVVITSEPRKKTGEIGRLINKILNAKVHVPMLAMQYLYSAERAVNHATVVIPALKKGKVVISHRCFWSAVAYGVFDKGELKYSDANTKAIMAAQGVLSHYYQFIAPDITLYLDVAADTALERISGVKKSLEIYEKKKSLERVLLGYRYVAKQFPKEIVFLHGERSLQEVAKEAIEKLAAIIDNR
ncbi:MAG: dTMP kinase [bacterium]|nr:dTMP kinase [bacterium]